VRQYEFDWGPWPWDGMHPRDLTKAVDFLYLAARGAPVEPSADELQSVQLRLPLQGGAAPSNKEVSDGT